MNIVKTYKLRGWIVSCLLALVLVACSSKLTNENFTKIKNGMSEGEVQAILGEPSKVENSEVLGFRNTTYYYESGKTRVQISFINDGVITKNGNFE